MRTSLLSTDLGLTLASNKGVGAFAITLNRAPILLNGQSINLSKGVLTWPMN